MTIYELKVQVPRGALVPDMFEPNDTPERATSGTPGLQLSGPPGLTLHLLDELGTPVTEAERVGDGELRLDLAGVAPGGYVLRIGRDVDASARLAPGRLPAASFRLGPML